MIVHEKESYAVMGACFTVYKDKGCGLTESIYQECVEIEFEYLNLPMSAQPQLPVIYRGRTLKHRFIPDFICYGKVILEIKAVSKLTDEHRAQVLNYVHATGYELGLLVNFGHHPKIEYERIANTRGKVS
ncbi:MAG TPA: GxxExxY protein [Lacunisphaera sp.]|jgi:GxxExxY protein